MLLLLVLLAFRPVSRAWAIGSHGKGLEVFQRLFLGNKVVVLHLVLSMLNPKTKLELIELLLDVLLASLHTLLSKLLPLFDLHLRLMRQRHVLRLLFHSACLVFMLLEPLLLLLELQQALSFALKHEDLLLHL